MYAALPVRPDDGDDGEEVWKAAGYKSRRQLLLSLERLADRSTDRPTERYAGSGLELLLDNYLGQGRPYL